MTSESPVQVITNYILLVYLHIWFANGLIASYIHGRYS